MMQPPTGRSAIPAFSRRPMYCLIVSSGVPTRGDELAAIQKRRVHGVVAHGCDVRVTMVAREDREHQGREHFAPGGCIVAGKRQRAIANEGIEQSAHLAELDEEGQLPERCGGRGGVPFDVYPATEGIECDHGPRADQCLAFGFTHEVSPPLIGKRRQPPDLAGNSLSGQEFICRF